MKKIILSLAFIAAFGIVASAQSFRFGIKAGANLTKISGSSLDEKFELGYQAGAFAEIDFNKILGVQPEVLFTQSKTQTKTSGGVASDYYPNREAKLDYLSIPVLLRINASSLFTILVGPEYSILINNSNSLTQNGKDAFSSGNFGMIGGLQVNLKMLRVYGRYNIGLSNINDISNSEKWKQQQLQLGIGLRF